MLSNFCVIAIASSFLLKDLLEIGSHLYINNICLKKYILATSENFQYDPYTDTGYFGKVNESDFCKPKIFLNNLSNFVNFTIGDTVNAIWYKFYWHGSIKLQAIFNSMDSSQYLRATMRNSIFAYDVSGDGKKQSKVKNINYHFELIKEGRTFPCSLETKYYNNVNSAGVNVRYKNLNYISTYNGEIMGTIGRLSPNLFPSNNWNNTGPEGIVVDGVKILGTHWDTIRSPNTLIGNPASSCLYTGTYFLNTSYKVWTWALSNEYYRSYGLVWLDLGAATIDDLGCESWFTGSHVTSDLAPCATYDIPKVD